MHINQLRGLIPASFTAQAFDEEGNVTEGVVNIKLRRMSYKAVTQAEFKSAMEKAKDDPQIIGSLLAGQTDVPGLLAEWELFEDEEKTKMFPITVENIIQQPFDFVADLSTCVFEKLFPNPQKAGTSETGSVPAQASESQTTSSSDTTSPSPQDSGESAPGSSSQEMTASTGSTKQ